MLEGINQNVRISFGAARCGCMDARLHFLGSLSFVSLCWFGECVGGLGHVGNGFVMDGAGSALGAIGTFRFKPLLMGLKGYKTR